MRKTFYDALNDLLAEYRDEDTDNLLSALELAMMAITENDQE